MRRFLLRAISPCLVFFCLCAHAQSDSAKVLPKQKGEWRPEVGINLLGPHQLPVVAPNYFRQYNIHIKYAKWDQAFRLTPTVDVRGYLEPFKQVGGTTKIEVYRGELDTILYPIAQQHEQYRYLMRVGYERTRRHHGAGATFGIDYVFGGSLSKYRSSEMHPDEFSRRIWEDDTSPFDDETGTKFWKQNRGYWINGVSASFAIELDLVPRLRVAFYNMAEILHYHQTSSRGSTPSGDEGKSYTKARMYPFRDVSFFYRF